MDRQKLVIGLILVILIIGVSLAAVFLLQKGIVVQAITPETEPPDRRIKAQGEIRLVDVAIISAPLSGLVDKVFVKPGDAVASGQPLFAYNAEDWQAQSAMKRLELRELQSALSQSEKADRETERRLRLDLKLQEDALEALLAQEKELLLSMNEQQRAYAREIDDLKTRVENGEKEVARLEALFDAGAVSKKELEQARYDLSVTRTDLQRAGDESARFVSEMVPLKRSGMQLRLNQAQTEVESARVALQEFSASLGPQELLRERILLARKEVHRMEKDSLQSTMVAPCAGTVLQVSVRAGHQVTEGAELVQIGGAGRLVPVLAVPASSLHRLSPGLTVEMTLEEVPTPVVGQIEWIAPGAENGLIEVRVGVTQGSDLLRGGMQVSAEISAPGQDVLVLPPQAVVDRRVPKTSPVLRVGEDVRYYVFLVDSKTHKIFPQQVKVGTVAPGYVEIVSGLRPDHDVVVGDAKALARLKASLEEWERKDVKEIRAVFEPQE